MYYACVQSFFSTGRELFRKMSKDEKARETPPWTMFFEGPLYRKYDDFMRHHDFSKVCDSRNILLLNVIIASRNSFLFLIFICHLCSWLAFPSFTHIAVNFYCLISVVSENILWKLIQQLNLVMRKPAFSYAKTNMQISFAVTAKLISAFVFASRIVEFLYNLNPKFQASCYLLWLYSPVCVGSGRKPENRFSHNENQLILDSYFEYN